MKYPKTKIQISDIFDIFVSYIKFNKNGIYKQFIILSSISQLIRGKTHYKNNFINYIKKFGKYVFLLLRLLFFYRIKIRFKKDKALKTKCDLLIIYPNSDKWILKGLSNDLAREIKKLACNVETDEIRNIKKYDAKHIFFSHHNLAIPTIINNPEYINKSSTYISHLRTISNIEVELLNKFRNIFCQSEKDKMRLNSFGFLPGRVIYFPVGYDDKLFYK